MKILTSKQRIRRKSITVLTVFALVGYSTCTTFAQSIGYLGIYAFGNKLGYSSYSEFATVLDGQPVKETVSNTVIKAQMMGNSLSLTMKGKNFTRNGKPIEFDSVMSSQGHNQDLIAKFKGSKVYFDVNNSGSISHFVKDLPPGLITDDPLSGIVLNGVKKDFSKTIYVLDPTTVSFLKTKVIFKGNTQVKVSGKEVTAYHIAIVDPRATQDVYVKGSELVKIDGPMGMELIPEPKEKALAGFGDSKVDLAFGSRIVPTLPEGAQPNWEFLDSLQVKIKTSSGAPKIPSLPGQTSEIVDGETVVMVEPLPFRIPSGSTIDQAEKLQPEWVKPDLNLPSNEAKFKELAKSIIGSSTDVAEAARKIQQWVYGIMTPDASVGVLRNANDVLATKRGVCRDYAILTATLCRAAGIPAQLATGLVDWNGDYYYHAWVLFYDGKNWVGLDSTTPDASFSASHIALAYGTLSQAFQTIFLQEPTLKVVSYK